MSVAEIGTVDCMRFMGTSGKLVMASPARIGMMANPTHAKVAKKTITKRFIWSLGIVYKKSCNIETILFQDNYNFLSVKLMETSLQRTLKTLTRPTRGAARQGCVL